MCKRLYLRFGIRALGPAPITLMYQTGYLTIKGYEPRFNSFYLDCPNEEVKSGFQELKVNFSSETKTVDGWAMA